MIRTVWISCLILAAALTAAAEDDKKTDDKDPGFKTVKTKEGLVFRVPEDMAIEIRDGIQVPQPFEEYIYAKVKKLDERVARIEARIEHNYKPAKSSTPVQPEKRALAK